MKTKICTKCNLEKPIEEFNNNQCKTDGKQSECKQCHRLLCNKYYQNNKQQYRNRSKVHRLKIYQIVNNIKKSGCCKCGEKDIACLDFHHINNKIKSISSLIANENLDLINKEIQKCIILCANCHRKLHYYKNKLII